MFIVPPFFCPEADGRLDLLDAGPANAAAINIAAPSAAIAPEAKTFLDIDLLPSTSNGLTVPFRRVRQGFVSRYRRGQSGASKRPSKSNFRFLEPFIRARNAAT